MMCLKYGISHYDFEVLMFIDDLVYFTKKQFKEETWWSDWGYYRFERLMEKDFVDKVAGTGTGRGNPTKYKIAFKGRKMVTAVYQMCYGEKEIPESTLRNPIMKKENKRHVKMAKYIINYNKNIRKNG